MNETIVKGALAMSLSLLCAGVSPFAKAADPPDNWTFIYSVGDRTVVCKVNVLPTPALAFGKYQVDCGRKEFATVSLVSDDMFTYKWTAAGGTTKSTRYVCGGDTGSYPQAYFGGGACFPNPLIRAHPSSSGGMEVVRTNTYVGCRAGLPPLGVHHRFWQEGTITFAVKLTGAGAVRIITTPVLKSAGSSHYAKDRRCNIAAVYPDHV